MSFTWTTQRPFAILSEPNEVVSMKDQRFQTFDEFWPHYVRAHEKKATRVLHFVGLTAAAGCVATGLLLRKPLLIAVAPLAGYGPAWIGHFFIEKNRPATLDYPVWSLQAEILMCAMMLAGTMDAEVERIMSRNGYHHAPVEETAAVQSALDEQQRMRRARETLN